MRSLLSILSGLLCLFALAAQAEAPDPIEQHNSNAIWFENWRGLSSATLKVTSPDGRVSQVFAQSGTPVFQLPGRDSPDGIWRYEVSAATEESVEIVNPVDNGRGSAQSQSVSKPFYLTGFFTVSRGVIIRPDDISETDN